MDEWIEKFQDKLLRLDMKIHILRKYVDDVVCVLDNVRPGKRLINDKCEELTEILYVFI